MKLETKLQCPNCKAKFVLSREVDSMSREVSSYVPLECFRLLCKVANLKTTEERAFRWLCEYRIEFGDRIPIVLATLTPREEKVLRMRFGVGEKQNYTLEEVGKVLGVTRERVRQIEAKAIMRLRHPARSKMLKDLIERIRKAKGTFPLFLLKPI